MTTASLGYEVLSIGNSTDPPVPKRIGQIGVRRATLRFPQQTAAGEAWAARGSGDCKCHPATRAVKDELVAAFEERPSTLHEGENSICDLRLELFANFALLGHGPA